MSPEPKSPRPPAPTDNKSAGIAKHIDDPHGILKNNTPATGLGEAFAFIDGQGEKRTAGDRAAEGILGDQLAEVMRAQAKEEELFSRLKAEGMLDEHGHLKPASDIPLAPEATGPERFINPAKGGGRGVGGSKKE